MHSAGERMSNGANDTSINTRLETWGGSRGWFPEGQVSKAPGRPHPTGAVSDVRGGSRSGTIWRMDVESDRGRDEACRVLGLPTEATTSLCLARHESLSWAISEQGFDPYQQQVLDEARDVVVAAAPAPQDRGVRKRLAARESVRMLSIGHGPASRSPSALQRRLASSGYVVNAMWFATGLNAFLLPLAALRWFSNDGALRGFLQLAAVLWLGTVLLTLAVMAVLWAGRSEEERLWARVIYLPRGGRRDAGLLP